MSLDADRDCHDFRNQLGIIQGFAAVLLAEAATDDPRRDDYEAIHDAATAALGLLRRLYPDRTNTPR